MSECTAINAASAVSMKAAAACRTILDLTGIRTSDPATWPDYGVKSLVRSPQCSLSRDAAPKGSHVRWRVWKSAWYPGMWVASPSEGYSIIAMTWFDVMEAMNAEVARRKRSTDLGR